MSFGIRVIAGKFGVGKGVTNSIIAINEMRDKNIYNNSITAINELNKSKNREYKTPPQNHVVFSNYTINDRNNHSYDFDPEKFMLPNEEFDYEIFPPYSCFHIEEAQAGSFSAYEWGNFPAPALMAFSRIRHPKIVFTMDMQFIENINKNLRRFAFEYIIPLELEHKKNCLNKIITTISHCAVFFDYNKALAFQDSQDKNLVEEFRDYTFNGNIYNHYNSYSKQEEFYNTDNKKDFIYTIKGAINKC